MDQGWKRLPLLVVFLLFWKNADGSAYSINPSAGQWLGQSSDNTFLPLVVQSSVPEAPVSGVLLEEVVSSLPKSRPKFNLLQVVKGGVSSISDSTSHALPSNDLSSTSSLPEDQSGMGGLVSLQGSSGSTTAYAASGSGQMVFTPGQSGSFPSNTEDSGQSTNDQSSPSLSSSASQGTTYGVNTQAQGTSQFAQGSSSPYATISLPKYVTSRLTTGPSSKPFVAVYGTQTGSSAPFTLKGSTYGGPLQGQDATTQTVSVSSTPYVAVSLPQGVSSQLTKVPSSKPLASVYTTQTGSSAPFILQGLLQGQGSTSQVVSGLSTPYVAVSLPQGVTGQLTRVPSPKPLASVYTTQTGSLAPFTLQGLLQGQGSTSQLMSGSSTPYVAVSLPHGVTSQLTPVASSEQVTSVYTTQTGSSAPFSLQGSATYGELLQAQGTTGQLISGSLTPYVAVSFPQGVTSQSAVPSSKQITSIYGTKTGSSAPFTLQGLLQGQGSTSQVVTGSSTPYVAVSLPQVVTSQLTRVPSSKPLTSVYTTQTGSSAPFTLQGLLQGQGSTSQLMSGSSTPYVAVSLPHGVTSQLTPVASSEQITSIYGTKTGSSAPFTLQGLFQGQGSTSQVVSGSSTPYVAVSLPQGVTSQLTPVASSEQITSVYTTQTGSSAPFSLQGSATYGDLLQPQGTAGQLTSGSFTPYVAVSLPQGVTSQLTQVPSSKPLASVYTTQTGSSAPFTLRRLVHGQDTTGQLTSGSSTPYIAVSFPQGVASQSAVPSLKQITTIYGPQTGPSAPTLQGVQPQGATDQFSTGSSSSILQTSTADASNPSSSFSTLRRYYVKS